MTCHVTALLAAIILKRPVLQEILDRWGDQSLANYANGFRDSYKDVPDALKREFINAVRSQAAKVFGDAEAESIAEDLKANYYALTADHHGPLTHPFFSDMNLLTLIASTPHQHNVLVLANSLVSLNNSSYPRGLLYHSDSKLEKLNIFPASMRNTSVSTCRSYTQDDLDRLKADIRKRPEKRELLEKVGMLLEEPSLLEYSRFGEQVSLINRRLPFYSFEGNEGVAQLAYLEMESVVLKLLQDHHLYSPTSIHELLFNHKLRHLFAEQVDGSLSGGTDYFWYEPKGLARRIPLRNSGDGLVAVDQSHRITMTPDVVSGLLERKELIPSTILSLIIVSGYYGVRCLGGFNQTTYLTNAQSLFNRLILDAPADRIEHTQTLGADFCVGYLQTSEGLVAATGLDLLLFGAGRNWDIYNKLTRSLTVRQAFYATLPYAYTDLYRENEQQADLQSITTDDILEHFGFKTSIESIN